MLKRRYSFVLRSLGTLMIIINIITFYPINSYGMEQSMKFGSRNKINVRTNIWYKLAPTIVRYIVGDTI